MGQAKNRGTFEERMNIAKGKKINLYSDDEYLRLIGDSTNLKVPRFIDENVLNFCKGISNKEPIYLDVIPEPYSMLDNCDINVEKKISKDGGSLIAGYKIWYLEDAYLIAERHAVWGSDNNQLIDINYDVELNTEILFVPDDVISNKLDDRVPRIDKALIKKLENLEKIETSKATFFWANQKKQSQLGLSHVLQTENYESFIKNRTPISDILKLKDILPLEKIRESLGSHHNYKIEYRRSLEDFFQDRSLKGSFFELCASGWHNNCLEKNLNNLDSTIGDSFNANNKYLYKELEKKIGQLIFQDIISIKVYIDNEPTPITELFLSKGYPNVLRINDVSFKNIYKPKEKYQLQEYEGLNAFSALIENAKKYCKQHNLKKIILTAGALDLIPFFEKHGFEVEDSELARKGIEIFKAGVPMFLNI